MMAEYLEIYQKTKYKKNNIKQFEHKNIYDDYFLKTAKLWKNPDSEIKLIENKSFARIFFKNIKPAYFEIFEEPRTELLEISKKISLLYAPFDNDKHNYDKNYFLGFRYYEKNKLEKCNYFTLVKKQDKQFFILEKEKNILDINGDSFYDKKLDCYSFIKNIVFEK